jgi:hypothetical protein
VPANNAFVVYEESANEPANKATRGKGESETAMEPLVLGAGSRPRSGLSALALELSLS